MPPRVTFHPVKLLIANNWRLMEPMDTTKNRYLDLINVAIQKLLNGRGRDAVLLDDKDRNLLSQLLSQVESFKGSESNCGPEVKDAAGEISTIDDDAKNNEVAVITADKIAKELMHVKKQNTVTHWLLSIMIVVTVAWQVSEVSLILKMKDNLRHPLRSVRNLVSGFFRGKAPAAEGDAEKDKSSTTERDKNSVLPAIPSIKIPGLPMIDLTNFPSKDDDSDCDHPYKNWVPEFDFVFKHYEESSIFFSCLSYSL